MKRRQDADPEDRTRAQLTRGAGRVASSWSRGAGFFLGLLLWDCGGSAGAVEAAHQSPTPALSPQAESTAGFVSWERIHAGGVPGRDCPTSGEDGAMVYDPVRRCVLLYGGKGSDDVNRSELWSFDTATRDWSQLEPQGLPPKAREDHTLVLDLANDQLVLYGGENGPTSNETWTFDLKSNRWTNITHDSAPALESHVAIYDPKGKRMVVFGGMQEKLSKKGEKEREIQDDTWTLDLAQGSAGYGSWTKVPVTAKPSARREHKGAYDPTRYRMIIFGGRQRSRASFLDDVWTLDLATMIWHEIEAGGEKPDPIRQMALGYDPTANTLTVFGGEVHITLDKTHEEERTVNQVWVLELDSGVWSDRTPYPRPMYDHVGTFVPELGGTLIYGGSAHKLGKEHATWLIRPR